MKHISTSVSITCDLSLLFMELSTILNSGNTVFAVIASHAGTFPGRARPVGLERCRHTSINEGLHTRREITGLILGVINLSYHAAVEGVISKD